MEIASGDVAKLFKEINSIKSTLSRILDKIECHDAQLKEIENYSNDGTERITFRKRSKL
jgi:hypothetical protein